MLIVFEEVKELLEFFTHEQPSRAQESKIGIVSREVCRLVNDRKCQTAFELVKKNFKNADNVTIQRTLEEYNKRIIEYYKN